MRLDSLDHANFFLTKLSKQSGAEMAQNNYKVAQKLQSGAYYLA